MLSRIGINDFPRSVRLYSTLGGICAEDMVALNLEAEHKTVANLETRKAFTLAVPGTDTLRESDFFGIASSNKMADKFERTGLHTVKSERVLGKIVNVIADEEVKDAFRMASLYLKRGWGSLFCAIRPEECCVPVVCVQHRPKRSVDLQ